MEDSALDLGLAQVVLFNHKGVNTVTTTCVCFTGGGRGDGLDALHIDLNNLDDPRFEDSKYVLTSPRSLEACSALSIKVRKRTPLLFEI